MPLLAEDRPDLRLKIVGQDPSARVHALASDRVEVIGPVADPVPHLHAATCSIAPLFIGGGTRIKILESLAAGCPVVSTSVGAEALDLAPDSLSLADGSGAFRAAILSILDDPAAAHAKARTSSAAVRARYSWEASAAALLDAWESCCAKTPA
jgi:glycosyltransferase involved in cell wall biosynthesis